jgi:hypothetical protein
MSECNQLSERMPLVVLGRVQWTQEEVRHLGECRSCQDEWELIRLTSRMGESPLVRLDASAISRGLLAQLKESRMQRLRRRAWSFAGLAAAATLAAVIRTERPADRPVATPTRAVVAQLQIPLPELDNLQSAELDSVLQTLDESLAGGASSDGPGLGDLDSSELQNVLDYWEG